MNDLSKLHDKKDHVRRELLALDEPLAKANEAFAKDEVKAELEDREPSVKLKAKRDALVQKYQELESRSNTIGRAIAEVQRRDEAERDQRKFEAIEAFRIKAGPQMKRINKAIAEVRNATQDLFQLLDTEKPQIVSLDAFLWPHKGGMAALEGMQGRFARMQIMSGAVAMITDDLQHSKFGPQQPEDWS